MATTISFPASPTLNQTYTYGGVTYVWTGTAWQTFTNLSTLGDPLVNKLQVDNTSTYIDTSTNNMTFTDPTTGTKTLAELFAVPDTSVTYAKVANTLKSAATVTSTVDLSANAIGKITLSANTAFTFTNFELGKSYLLIITANGYTPSWAVGAKHVPVTGNETFGTTGVFYVNLTCIDATSGSEKLLTMIMKG